MVTRTLGFADRLLPTLILVNSNILGSSERREQMLQICIIRKDSASRGTRHDGSYCAVPLVFFSFTIRLTILTCSSTALDSPLIPLASPGVLIMGRWSEPRWSQKGVCIISIILMLVGRNEWVKGWHGWLRATFWGVFDNFSKSNISEHCDFYFWDIVLASLRIDDLCARFKRTTRERIFSRVFFFFD